MYFSDSYGNNNIFFYKKQYVADLKTYLIYDFLFYPYFINIK